MDELGASVYSEAKSEYTKQLTIYLMTPYHRFFMALLQQAGEEEPNSKKILSKFQDYLSQIPEWNMDKVERETQKIITDSRCDYLEDLITAVFIAHTKVLTAIRLGSKNKKVQITIPKLNHFLHRTFTECSRLLWTSVYLFQSDLPSLDKQRNHRQIEVLLQEGIQQAIRSLLPVKNILRDYLTEGNDGDDAEEADNEEEEAKEEEVVPKVPDATPESAPEPVSVPVAVPVAVPESVPEPVSVPESAPESVSVPVAVPESVPESVPEPEPVSAPVGSNTVNVIKETTSESPIINLENLANVQFADMVHEIKGDSMRFSPSVFNEDDNIKILDDEGSDLSDVEDLDNPEVDLGDNDYETL